MNQFETKVANPSQPNRYSVDNGINKNAVTLQNLHFNSRLVTSRDTHKRKM